MASGKQYIVRLVSSKDHEFPKAVLLQSIRGSGTDRYDDGRKQMFSDFYGPHNVDFFGTLVEATELEKVIPQLSQEFGSKTLGDRQRNVGPDIAIIYKASKCEMIQHVYKDRLTSDCFRFLGDPKEALEGVREL